MVGKRRVRPLAGADRAGPCGGSVTQQDARQSRLRPTAREKRRCEDLYMKPGYQRDLNSRITIRGVGGKRRSGGCVLRAGWRYVCAAVDDDDGDGGRRERERRRGGDLTTDSGRISNCKRVQYRARGEMAMS